MSVIAKVVFTVPDYETGDTEPAGFVVADENELRLHTLNGEILYRASWEQWAFQTISAVGGQGRPA